RGKDTKERLCRIYTTQGVIERGIEVQQCTCHRHGDQFTIGPDLGEHGLFNWNNEIIVSHELFNDYSSQLVVSPTPLNSFQRNCRHRFAEVHSPHPFLPKTTFNLIFYAFARHQFTDTTFDCPICGDQPELVICDGVSTAFHAKERLPTLRPPTVPDDGHTCDDVKPPKGTPFLATPALRKSVLTAVRTCRRALERVLGLSGGGAGLESHLVDDSEEEDDEESAGFSSAPLVEAIQALRSTTSTGRGKKKTPPSQEALSLADVFEDLVTSPGTTNRLTLLILELSAQVAAHESILQLCRQPLARSIANAVTPRAPAGNELPARLKARQDLQSGAPAIGSLLNYLEEQQTSPSPSITLLLLRIAAKANSVQIELTGVHITPPPTDSTERDDWRKTGVCYAAPKIRSHPFYSKFKEVGSAGADGVRWGRARSRKKGEKDGLPDCQKFYKEYSEARLTGGIM
ncbi:hypothetical protein P7C70_g9332, partial [Phenoliferia sp. Uapishka_3]